MFFFFKERNYKLVCNMCHMLQTFKINILFEVTILPAI